MIIIVGNTPTTFISGDSVVELFADCVCVDESPAYSFPDFGDMEMILNSYKDILHDLEPIEWEKPTNENIPPHRFRGYSEPQSYFVGFT